LNAFPTAPRAAVFRAGAGHASTRRTTAGDFFWLPSTAAPLFSRQHCTRLRPWSCTGVHLLPLPWDRGHWDSFGSASDPSIQSLLRAPSSHTHTCHLPHPAHLNAHTPAAIPCLPHTSLQHCDAGERLVCAFPTHTLWRHFSAHLHPTPRTSCSPRSLSLFHTVSHTAGRSSCRPLPTDACLVWWRYTTGRSLRAFRSVHGITPGWTAFRHSAHIPSSPLLFAVCAVRVLP